MAATRRRKCAELQLIVGCLQPAIGGEAIGVINMGGLAEGMAESLSTPHNCDLVTKGLTAAGRGPR